MLAARYSRGDKLTGVAYEAPDNEARTLTLSPYLRAKANHECGEILK